MGWEVSVVDEEALRRSAPSVAAALAGERDEDDLVALVGAADPFKSAVIRLQASLGDEVVGTAVGHLEGSVAHLDLVAVAPAWQGRGIGGALLLRYEDEAARLGATSSMLGGSVRRYAWPGVDLRRTSALALAVRHGYRRTETALNLWVDLDRDLAPAPETLQPLADKGIEVCRATAAYGPALAAAAGRVMPAMAGVWGEELRLALEGAGSSVHVAVVDGVVRAFAAQGVYRSGMFGPMGTEAELRGTGIGTVLLGRALEDIRRKGRATADIGWVAEDALPFYARAVGATSGAAFWVFSKPLP